jgi:glycerophosphoryl diester phosphodiesterase
MKCRVARYESIFMMSVGAPHTFANRVGGESRFNKESRLVSSGTLGTGQGIGLMPSLDEVLDHFPDRSLLIHVKSDDPHEGVLLAQYLQKLPAGRLARLTVYGGDQPIAALKQKLPKLRVMSKATAKRALIAYMAVGWTGYMPASMKNAFFYLPLKYARLLWGWPHRFIQKINGAHSYFVVVLGNGEWSEGFDTEDALRQLPPDYQGGIWTNRIDRIGPLLRMK